MAKSKCRKIYARDIYGVMADIHIIIDVKAVSARPLDIAAYKILHSWLVKGFLGHNSTKNLTDTKEGFTNENNYLNFLSGLFLGNQMTKFWKNLKYPMWSLFAQTCIKREFSPKIVLRHFLAAKQNKKTKNKNLMSSYWKKSQTD